MAKSTLPSKPHPRSADGTFKIVISEALARKMHKDYQENGVSYSRLSQKYGFSRSSIYEAFRRHQLPTSLVRSRKPNAKLIQKIARLYTAGKTLPEIRTMLGLRMHTGTMTSLLRMSGIALRSRTEEEARRWKKYREKIPLIVAAYREGNSVPKIAQRYKVRPSFCYSWLRRNGVRIRHHNDPIYNNRYSGTNP